MNGVDGISGFRNEYKLRCDPDYMEMLLKTRIFEYFKELKKSNKPLIR